MSKKPSSPSAGKNASAKAGGTKNKCSKRRVIVIDPGHGGKKKKPGSSPNNATAPSKIKEKTLTLQYAKSLQRYLLGATVQKIFKSRGFCNVQVVLTRGTDVNIAGRDRVAVATKKKADIFASIHFNGNDSASVRGTETFYRRSGAPAQSNAKEDKALAKVVNDAMVKGIRSFDKGAKNRGVKSKKRKKIKVKGKVRYKQNTLGVLRDPGKGLSGKMCRSLLMEVEFITNKTVDKLMVSGKSAGKNRDKIMLEVAKAMAKALW